MTIHVTFKSHAEQLAYCIEVARGAGYEVSDAPRRGTVIDITAGTRYDPVEAAQNAVKAATASLPPSNATNSKNATSAATNTTAQPTPSTRKRRNRTAETSEGPAANPTGNKARQNRRKRAERAVLDAEPEGSESKRKSSGVKAEDECPRPRRGNLKSSTDSSTTRKKSSG